MEELIKSGVIQKKSFLSKLGITDATIQKREHMVVQFMKVNLIL